MSEAESESAPMARSPESAILGLETERLKEEQMRKLFGYGGIAASVVLIAFGIGSIVVGFSGRDEVRSTLAREHIVGTPDMKKDAIAAEARKAGLAEGIGLPTCDVAGRAIDSGSEARCFASYMRIHALEAAGGQTYAEMGRFLDKKGKPTSDEKLAATGANGKPVENPVRQTWVTETALSTALNTSFFAERVAVFSIVMGVALLLTGIGFLVLTVGGALGVVSLPLRQRKLGTASAQT